MTHQLIVNLGIAIVLLPLLLVPRLTRSILLESLLHPFRRSEFKEHNGRIQGVRQ